MANTAVIQTGKSVFPYLPIYLDSLVVDTVLDFDLFLSFGREMILYRSSRLPFTERSRSRLVENNVSKLFVPITAKQEYKKYIENNLTKIVEDPAIPEKRKAAIVYDSSKVLVKDILDNPSLSENIERSKNMVGNHVLYIMRGKEAFLNLLKIASFDYYLYTHSVNVCSFSIALAMYLGIKDKESLWLLGLGALLHDVGKSKISGRILNKSAPLNRAEFEIVKKHPSWGKEILNETDIIPDEAYYPIMQHHERFDGSGYPRGISGSEIHHYGRIIAVCDVFDALTTQRVYQDAMGTYPALREMYNQRQAYDGKILEAFTMLMGPNEPMLQP
jgi:HD-GYP domain-containing protein (c-di-GMP phosphodiesterase class II)